MTPVPILFGTRFDQLDLFYQMRSRVSSLGLAYSDFGLFSGEAHLVGTFCLQWAQRCLLRLGRKRFDMRLKLFQTSPAGEIEADHFVRAFSRLTTGVNQDQQARDDRHVHLNFHTFRLGAQQVTAPQQLFDHAEEEFDHPALAIRLGSQANAATRTAV